MFEDKCVWSALYPISNHSHIRQLQFATHAFSQQVLQQAVQISICQWRKHQNESGIKTSRISDEVSYQVAEIKSSISCSIYSQKL